MLVYWNSLGTQVAPLGAHYPDFKPISLCFYSLILYSLWRSSKYQFCSLWFDLTETRIPIVQTLGKHANNYTINVVLWNWSSNTCTTSYAIQTLYLDIYHEDTVDRVQGKFLVFVNVSSSSSANWNTLT